MSHLNEDEKKSSVKNILASAFPGWSLFLYNYLEDMHQKREGQAVNYPYLHLADTEEKLMQKQRKLEIILEYYNKRSNDFEYHSMDTNN